MDSRLIAMIKLHEGLRLKPYQCTANKTTIGYGRNLQDRGITPEEAAFLLRNDLDDVTRQLSGITEYQSLDEVRRAVLIDMTFNLGLNGVLAFKRMWKAINKRAFNEAAHHMLDSQWARQVGARAQRLAAMMRTGEWQ